MAELNSGEKLVGKNVEPRVGMKVVGAVNSGYEKLGKGTITAIVQKNGTSCNVAWDDFGPGQKYGYCAGFRGRYHLAMFEVEPSPDCSLLYDMEKLETADSEVLLSPFVLVGKDVSARIGLRVMLLIEGKDQNFVGTIVALREGGNVCDVRWDQSGNIQSGIPTGLMSEFNLAVLKDDSTSIVVGRDIKPAVGQHVRPLTFKDTGGVEGIFTDSTGMEKGLITQVLPEGDVVVKWQTKPGEKPRGGIYQTGRHGTYFLALDDDADARMDSRRGVRDEQSSNRHSLQQPMHTSADRLGRSSGYPVDDNDVPSDSDPRLLVCGRDVAPSVGQQVTALADGARSDRASGQIIAVDAGGLGVIVRWNTGEETSALTGRFGKFDLGALAESRRAVSSLFGS